MTDNPALHILRICLALVAAPWALAIAAFILTACTIAQMLALFTSVTVFTITRRWAPAANIIRDVAKPRIAYFGAFPFARGAPFAFWPAYEA